MRNTLLLAIVTTLTGAAGLAPAAAPADGWPQFRGARRDGIVPPAAAGALLDAWPAEGPKTLWKIEGLGLGYSGPAIAGDRVFFNDYDAAASTWMIRCVSLADGKELWRWSYRRRIRKNHGITRTVPATDGRRVVSFDPKAVLHGIVADTGEQTWSLDLPRRFGSRIPPWYNGQCPLLDEGRLVVGVGGREILMAAVHPETGDILWTTPNTARHKLSHSSVMPAVIGGRRQYLWCTLQGMVSVDAQSGELLWEALWTPARAEAAAKVGAYAADKPNVAAIDWRTNTAVSPSPVAVGDGRVFMSAGYKAGCLMLKVDVDETGVFKARRLWTLPADQFNFDCHTPVLFNDRLLGVEHGASNKGRFACLNLDGTVAWRHDGATFGLGGWMLVGDKIFVMDGDTGVLRMLAADADAYRELAAAPVAAGHEAWAPMAYADGKLIVRNIDTMVCLQVGAAD